MTGIIIFSVIILGILLFFARFRYTSPVDEAGRDYRKNIELYQDQEIDNLEDVYERLEVFDAHLNSPTFDKMQGGEKVEITPSDIESLFGPPDRIFEDVEMHHYHTVYQYDFDPLTLSFHEEFRGIWEYVIEDYYGILYAAEDLNQLFVAMIANQAADFDQIMKEQSPTRKITRNSWDSQTVSPHSVYYFDDGSGDYAPEEYLLLRYQTENEELLLHSMERRYQETYDRLDSAEEAKRKDEAYDALKIAIDDTETITVADLSDAFGGIARFNYNNHSGLIRIIWLSNHDFKKEFFTEMPIQNLTDIKDLNDLNDLTINHLDFKRIHDSDPPYRTDQFIGSE